MDVHRETGREWGHAPLSVATLLTAVAFLVLAFVFPASWLAPASGLGSAGQQESASLAAFPPVLFVRVAWFLNGLLLLGLSLYLRRSAPAQTLPLQGPSDAEERLAKTEYWGLALIVAIAAVLRLWKLGGDLWFDEVIDLAYYIRLPFQDILSGWPGFFPQVLSALFAKGAAILLGETSFALRLPAAVFGILGVVAIYPLARLLLGKVEAVWITLLLAVSYHHIFFSQNARGYTMQVFFTIVATLFILRIAHDGRASHWHWYGIASVLNIYTHFFSVFVWVGHSLTYLGRSLLLRRQNGRWPRELPGFLWATALIGSITFLLYSPMVPGILVTVSSTAKAPAYGAQSSAAFAGELLQGMRAGYGLLPLVFMAGIGILGLGSLLRRSPYAVSLLLLPLLVGMATVRVVGLGIHPRFFLFMLPAGLVILVRGLACGCGLVGKLFRPPAGDRVARGLATAAVLVVVVASLMRLVPYYRLPKQDFSGAFAFAQNSRTAGEPVVAVGLAAHAYQAYYVPGIQVVRSAEELEALRRKGQRVWLLYTLPFEIQARNPEMLEYIRRHFAVIRRFPGTIGEGTLFVCRAEPLAEGQP